MTEKICWKSGWLSAHATLKAWQSWASISSAPGGLLDDEGKPKRSVLVLDFEDRAALDEYLKNEPYVTEQVWEKIEVESLNVVIVDGKKVGG